MRLNPDRIRKSVALSAVSLRPGTLADTRQIVDLNLEFVAVTSPMDSDRFRHLFGCASLVTVAEMDGRVVAFLTAMADGTAYENGNFQWFAERLRRFIYIDRVVVSSGCRNQGIGSALYAHALSWAKQAGLLSLVAEMDLDPPNIGSLNFHKNKGFVQLGTRVLDSAKTVSMQARSV